MNLLRQLSKELKQGIDFSRPSGFKLWIITVKMLSRSITQELLGLPNFDAIFEFLGQFTIRCIFFFQKSIDNFEIEHKTC